MTDEADNAAAPEDATTPPDDTAARREQAMRELTAARDSHQKREDISKGRRGLVIVNTGNGKGKTTAALGLMLRAHGRGLRVKMFQFLKHESAKFGEHRTLDALGIAYQGLGDGFTWRSRDLENTASLAQHGWELASAAILSGEYDLVVLDEFTYPLTYGWVAWADVQATLQARDPLMHVVITGRDALPELIALADTVSEVQPLKHAYDAGIGAQRGVEY
ncbi:cob(I)yrinic acid a,c-diamide adenosyltransferase [Deinococcus ruber]|uniref:Cob(I)alamin adenosyltransferase n=1 Tax=Deinococcus ruber TaxID=1848197 RepID=A0A918BZH5_9DEIO|nr:cob(I)alamin adenosyltransferase [Deinococcus ruber]